jgi:hypothetical protein
MPSAVADERPSGAGTEGNRLRPKEHTTGALMVESGFLALARGAWLGILRRIVSPIRPAEPGARAEAA